MENILIIRFSSIGDIVLTTPVIRCLKEQLPGARIHFLTKRQFEPVLKANPYVDRLHLYDGDFKSLMPQLRSEGISYIIDLHKNYRSSFVKQHFNVPAHTFPKINVQKWLAVNLKWNVLPDIHIVDRYFKATEALGIENDHRGLDYFIHAADEVELSSLPVTHQQGYVAVVTGAKHQTKIFPAGMVAEICRRVGKSVILLGGKEDKAAGDEIVSQTSSLVFNACGLYRLNQSASLVRQSLVVLSNDTGLMHIAAAFNKPIVSVWGNTIPGFGMYPYLPKENPAPSLLAQVNGLRCRPCSKIGHRKCPKKHFRCMNDIDIEPIIQFLTAHSHQGGR